jgi:hypothetical protein
MDAVKATIQGLDAQELERICEPPATPPSLVVTTR